MDGEQLKSSFVEAHPSASASESQFSRVSDARCDVVDNKISAVLENRDRDGDGAGAGVQPQRSVVPLELCSRRLVESLNSRARFREVFDLNARKVLLGHDGLAYRLDEGLVDELLADRRVSCSGTLETIVFELAGTGRELSYLARVNVKRMMTTGRLVPQARENPSENVARKPLHRRDRCEHRSCASTADNVLQVPDNVCQWQCE